MSWPEYIVQIEPHKEGDLFHMRGEPEPIVRCRDCKFMDKLQDDGYVCSTDPDGFCAWGERKDD